ncbi:MAG: hypothetical protein V3V38_01200 [Nitrosopumilaceae archaeon]
MSCKGICGMFKAECPEDGIRYAHGQKRCSYCEIYLVWERRSCPCCGTPLRTKSREKQSKTSLSRL